MREITLPGIDERLIWYLLFYPLCFLLYLYLLFGGFHSLDSLLVSLVLLRRLRIIKRITSNLDCQLQAQLLDSFV